MKTLILSLVLFGFVAVAPVSAGGGFDMSQLNADGSVKADSGLSAGSNPGSASSTSLEASDLAAASGQNSTAWQTALALVAAAGVVGFLIWSFRKSKV